MAAVRLFFLLLVLAVPAVGATHKPKPKGSGIADLSDTINKTVILTKFAALVQASDLGTFLSSRGPFTLFVPTNSAFSKLPPGMFEDFLRPENKVQLQRVILFQLVSGKAWDVKDLKTIKSLISCEGTVLPLRTTKGGTQFVNKAKIIRSDMKCSNGLMHQVDTLMMPPNLLLVAATAPDTSTNAAPASTDVAPATNAPPDPPASTNTAPDATPPPAPPSMR